MTVGRAENSATTLENLTSIASDLTGIASDLTGIGSNWCSFWVFQQRNRVEIFIWTFHLTLVINSNWVTRGFNHCIKNDVVNEYAIWLTCILPKMTKQSWKTTYFCVSIQCTHVILLCYSSVFCVSGKKPLIF